MKKVLITGGAGFVGANLARKLLSAARFEIFVIEKEKTNLWRLNDITDRITLKYVDLENSKSVQKIVEEIEPNIVFHLASYGVYAPLQADVRKMIRVNIEGTWNLISALKDNPPSTFIYTGTSFEYKGKDSKLKETDPIDPLNFYGVTKLTAGLLLKQAAQENNMSVINARLFTPYGFYEDGQRLIPHIVLRALQQKPIELSSPDNVRDFIFVEDVVDLFLQMVQGKQQYQGEVFNVGSGEQHRIEEVVITIEKALGKKLDVRYGQKSSPYQEPKVFVADNSKAREAFHWEVQHDLQSGIAKTIDWFQNNQELYLQKP